MLMAFFIGFVIAAIGALLFASSPMPDWLLRASKTPANQLQSRNRLYIAIFFFALFVIVMWFISLSSSSVNSKASGSKSDQGQGSLPSDQGQARLEQERRARLEQELEQERRARLEQELEQERQVRLEQERRARLEQERRVRLEQELEQERQARLEQERQARLEQERQARLEQERQARLEQERQARLEQERQQKEDLQEEVTKQVIRTVHSYYNALDQGLVDEAFSAWYSHDNPDRLRKAIERIADAQVTKIEPTVSFSSDLDTAAVRVTVNVRARREDWQTYEGFIKLRRSGVDWKIVTIKDLIRVQ